jgi:PleD family two-component response regulator
MSSFAPLCYDNGVACSLFQTGMPFPVEGERHPEMSNDERRILVLGEHSPLVEGVSDLLQLDGYQVDTSSSWSETEDTPDAAPPSLVIVDLSDSTSEAYDLPERVCSAPRWSKVPLLFIGFADDDRISELQRRGHSSEDRRLYFYAHTLLGMDGLLEKVQDCLT